VERDAKKTFDECQAIGQAKAHLRQSQRKRASQLPPTFRLAQSSSIINHLKEHSIWKSSTQIFAFVPMKDEPDIFPLLKEIMDEGKQLFLPRFEASTRTYHPIRVRNISTDLQPGKYGIPEPADHCPKAEGLHPDLTLVPGLAFDSRGWRLGRGKGFYDRMLASLGGIRCGMAFDYQYVELVPHETLDQKMDWIITPEGPVKAAL
jgi:5-formyltetrahydrofolate cyclo-ligase